MSNPSLKYHEANFNTASEVTELLNSLPLYEFYNKLDHELENAKNSESQCATCRLFVPMGKEGKTEQLLLCEKVCYIILNLNKISLFDTRLSSDKLCSYMRFWLYNYATKIPNFPDRNEKFYNALNTIISSPQSKINDCSLENYDINKDEFNNKHILYEFLENYDYIENKIKTEGNPKINLYCQYIKENFSFYNRIKNICATEQTCSKYKELDKFKEKFKEPNVINLIYDKCDYEKASCKNGFNGENDVPCLRKKGNSFLFLLLGDDPDDILNILLNLAIVSAPILAVFLILFKFTPLGKSLNKIKQERKKNGHKKKEENIQDYMKNYAAYLDSEMKNRVHLGYHAT
ncbi:PIR protein [Plasmodium vivax]|nr:PIR protein [Plasmodium vivax]